MVFEVAKTVEKVVKQNNLKKVDKIVLQIGELSSMIPKYVKDCYPAAVDGTMLEHTSLEIEIMPANAICSECRKVFGMIENRGICPACSSKSYEVLSGKEFMIKEIVAC